MEAVHPFPLIPAGGAFLIVAGALFALGWLAPKWFGPIMAVGFAAAGMAAWVALQIGADLGPAPLSHIAILAACIIGEIIALVWMYQRVKDERRSDAWVLIIVGLHFAPMVLILGPLALALSAATTALGCVALARAKTPILPFGLTDSALKIGFGAAMYALYRDWGGWLATPALP